jgi:hypothetical protein
MSEAFSFTSTVRAVKSTSHEINVSSDRDRMFESIPSPDAFELTENERK